MATDVTTTSGTESNLSTWAGPYVTEMLGQAQALGPATYDASGALIGGRPFQAYGAEQAKAYGDIAKNLVAGPSSLQTQAFQGLANLTLPSSLSTASQQAQQTYGASQQYMPTVGTVQSYMNPYLEAVLEPQRREASRQADIARQEMQGRMAKAGAYGGSRQAIMEAEGQRNLQNLLSDITGKGYAGAYDTAQKQRLADIEAGQKGLAAQTAATQALTNVGGQEAQYGLANLAKQLEGGATERGLAQDELTAAYNQFLREEQYPQQQLQFLRQMIAGIPGIASESYYQAAPSAFSEAVGGAQDLAGLLKMLKII